MHHGTHHAERRLAVEGLARVEGEGGRAVPDAAVSTTATNLVATLALFAAAWAVPALRDRPGGGASVPAGASAPWRRPARVVAPG